MHHLRSAFAASGLLAGLFATSCSSVHDDLSRDFLDPSPLWLVEPGALGLDAEPFALDVGGGSLTGFLIRSPEAKGRTVLLFHDSSTNVSMLHPYYTFLVAAGLNVCVFDYRGFGQSTGEPSMRGVFYDMPALLDWLGEHPDVDPQRIAYYGLALGSVVALHAAVHGGDVRALVVEDVPSPRDAIRQRIDDRGQVASMLAVGFTEFAGLPDDVEPSENSARLDVPSLWIAGADSPREELRATLRAYFAVPGDKQLWVLPNTGSAPHSLLTHDGEYQRAVAHFLKTAIAGAPEQIVTTWRSTGSELRRSNRYEVGLQRSTSSDREPWAVQVCALDAKGEPTWRNTWLDGERGTVDLELEAEPGAVSAMRIRAAERTTDGTFARKSTALTRAGKWYEEHFDAFERARTAEMPIEVAKEVVALIRGREELEPLPPLLEAEMADVHAGIGMVLADSKDAEDRAMALVWLERAIAAVPEHPERHYWPGKHFEAGFRQAAAIERARAKLARLGGFDDL